MEVQAADILPTGVFAPSPTLYITFRQSQVHRQRQLSSISQPSVCKTMHPSTGCWCWWVSGRSQHLIYNSRGHSVSFCVNSPFAPAVFIHISVRDTILAAYPQSYVSDSDHESPHSADQMKTVSSDLLVSAPPLAMDVFAHWVFYIFPPRSWLVDRFCFFLYFHDPSRYVFHSNWSSLRHGSNHINSKIKQKLKGTISNHFRLHAAGRSMLVWCQFLRMCYLLLLTVFLCMAASMIAITIFFVPVNPGKLR